MKSGKLSTIFLLCLVPTSVDPKVFLSMTGATATAGVGSLSITLGVQSLTLSGATVAATTGNLEVVPLPSIATLNHYKTTTEDDPLDGFKTDTTITWTTTGGASEPFEFWVEAYDEVFTTVDTTDTPWTVVSLETLNGPDSIPVTIAYRQEDSGLIYKITPSSPTNDIVVEASVTVTITGATATAGTGSLILEEADIITINGANATVSGGTLSIIETIINFKLTANQASITLTIATGGATDPDWLVTESDTTEFTYLATENLSHTRITAGAFTIEITNTQAIKTDVTTIDIQNESLEGTFEDMNLNQFTALSVFKINSVGNVMTGDPGSWTLPSTLTKLWIKPSSLVGNIEGWTLPSGLIELNIGNANNLNGDLPGNWSLPSTLTLLALTNCAGVTGDPFDGWGASIPSGLTKLQWDGTAFDASTGDLSNLTSLHSGITEINLQGIDLSGTGVFDASLTTALNKVRMFNCNLDEADIDALIQELWDNRATFTAESPLFTAIGINTAPSGIYADADPPTTGKEYAYELVNDPEIEGFNLWTVTYNS